MSAPVYLSLESGPLRDACREAFAPSSPESVSLDDLLEDDGAPPGLVLTSGQRPHLDRAAKRLQERDEAWTVAAVESGPDGPRIQAVSRSFAGGLTETAEAWMQEARPAPLLEIRGTLREIAKARHDINNPLTSALAEVQLLLMDVDDAEVREGLEVVEEQLRRIRDLVAQTGHLRPPGR